ncbi:MAG: type II secretion system F family protein [Kiritimatiellae bacterium]|nr:type II secretion system F family protein [Kiritimatiellia bacterium]
MLTFIYKAKDGPGKTVTGELQAETRSSAALELDAMGYSPVWIKEKGATSVDRMSFRLRRIARRDITVFTRQLASLTKSGVPILKALSTIADQSENPGLGKVVSDMERLIRDGGMLSDALAEFPVLFSELYVNMVRSGESAGVLDTILFRLAESREKEEDMRRKVQAAMAYPLLIVIVAIATVFILLAFFMPKVLVLFKGYGDLPVPTVILIRMSEFMSGSWHWILMIAGLVLAVFNRIATLDRGRTFVDGIKLGLPLIGKFIHQSDIARFARTLSLLIESNISIDNALALSGRTLQNAVLRAEIETVRHDTVQQGMPLSMGLKKAPHFPPLTANMCAVGEEAGRLDEALAEVASYYEKEVDQRSKLASSLIEPVLILIVGAIVGFVVSAMLLPIFKLSSTM